MMLLTKKHSGFTMVELMIVILIVGILSGAALSNFRSLGEKSDYETFIYTLQHYTQEAKNMSLVNESEWNGSSYSAAKSHGVVINHNLTKTKATVTLFQDSNDDGDYDTGEELKTLEEEKIIEVGTWSGIQSGNSTAASTFSEITILFQPDPTPTASITSNASTPEPLREVELKFFHIRGKGPKGLQKKYRFDTITKISQVNDYPLLTGGVKDSDTQLTITTNETLSGSAANGDFTITHSDDADGISVSNTSISGESIILTVEDISGLSNNNPISVIYKNGGSLTGDSILLQPRNLEINF
jgi:prepilin-type N-terminal cleavage/methylation domain-containing protein